MPPRRKRAGRSDASYPKTSRSCKFALAGCSAAAPSISILKEFQAQWRLPFVVADGFAGLRRPAAARRRDSFRRRRASKLCLVGRNGSGKSTLLQDRRGPHRGRRRNALPPARTRASAICRRSRISPASTAFALCRGRTRAGGRCAYRARRSFEASSASAARKIRRVSPAARRAAPRWRGRWRPSPTFCCSTSRPTISTCPAIEWLEAELKALRSALVIISHDRRFLTNLSRGTVWLDRGRRAELGRGFGDFEAWRDQELEEEERQRHKIDRKIVAEEHWLRYGVTARRKRNQQPARRAPCDARRAPRAPAAPRATCGSWRPKARSPASW